jgi:N-succinyl-L-ornithine transcarbamylase
MELDPHFTKGAQISYNQNEAFENADIIYVKNWSSYNDYGKVLDAPEWTIDSKKISHSNKAKVMHCLPVRRGVVLSDDILDSSNSIVIEQAENRIYAAQAVFSTLLKGSY